MKQPQEMSEGYFRKNVIDPWLKKHAKYWFATTGVISRNGIPDYCMQIGDITVYVEAKKVGGKLTAYEVNEIRKIHRNGVAVFVAHPLNWGKISTRILELAYPGISQTDMSRIEGSAYYAICNEPGNC